MPRGDYAQDKGINWSTLKHIRPGHGSPRHYRYAVDNPDTGDTPSRMGLRLTHAMVLEPENVARDFIVSEMRRDVLARRLALFEGDQPEKVGTVEWLAWCRLHDMEAEDLVTPCDARRGTKAWKAIAQGGGVPMKPADIEKGRALSHEMEQAADTIGKTIVSPKQHAEASAISGAVLAYPPAAAILARSTTETEVRLSWTDEATGLRCKGFADIVGDGFVIDLKTVRTTEPRQLRRDIVRMGYHIQGAHYCAGVEAMRDLLPGSLSFGILAVEGTAPHDVALVLLSPDMMEMGERERRVMLETVESCRETGQWDGHCPHPMTLEPEAWMLRDDD